MTAPAFPKTASQSAAGAPLLPRRAILSVSDKTGLIPLARALESVSCELFASGGTRKAIESEGIACRPVESLSRSPEAFQGRMKTLSFPVFGGILARRGDPADEADREKLGIPLVDAVVVNFYPFEAAGAEADLAELTELVDIGGPALVRAAAKNHASVLVLSDPSLYAAAIRDLETRRGTLPGTRARAAARAWVDVARYDAAIAARLPALLAPGSAPRAIELRYGENPHQSARFEFDPRTSPIAWDEPCTESSLSYNNILDFSAGFRLLSDLANWKPDAAHAVIVKHQNPCGVATDVDGRVDAALEMAWAGDPVSAFGGVVLLSQPLDAASARFLEPRFIEGLAAPGLSRRSSELAALATKRKHLKAVVLRDLRFQETECAVTVPGGRLVQSADAFAREELEIQTGAAWPPARRELAEFGIFAAKALKSNAIAIVECPAEGRFRLIGAGQGQPNRIEAIAKLAVPRARAALEADAQAGAGGAAVFVASRLAESLLVSDAFFPFADSVEVAHAAGIRHVVEPGGSVRDAEVVAKARELGLSLAFTRRRHFRH